MSRSKRKRAKSRRPPPPPRRVTKTFGIAALLLAVFTLVLMAMTIDEMSVSPMEVAVDTGDDASGEFDPYAQPTFRVGPHFAAVSVLLIVICVVTLSWVRGEGFWIGWAALTASAASISLERAVLTAALAVPLGVAVWFASREVRRRIKASR